MKRWPIGLAVVGTLLAVAIGGIAGLDGSPIASGRELAAPHAPEHVEVIDTSPLIEVESAPHVATRAVVPSPTPEAIEIAASSRDGICFKVRDSDGHPIERAIALTLDQPRIESGPTDAVGAGTLLDVPHNSAGFRVHAFGYRSTTVEAKWAGVGAPIEVFLEKLPGLNLDVEWRGGALPARIFVEIECTERRPFASEHGSLFSEPVPPEIEAPVPRIRFRADDKRTLYVYQAGGDGRLLLPGLDPKTTVAVRVEDVTGATLAQRELDPSCFRRDVPCTIFVDAWPRVLEVQVVDQDSRPIPRAKIRSKTNNARLAKTRAEGVARIESIFASEVDLQIEAAGFAWGSLDNVSMTREVERRKVVLTRGHSVRVRVVDRSGQPVPVESVDAQLDSRRIGQVSRLADEDCFLVDRLPNSTVALIATVGGTRISIDHDPSDPSAMIVTPDFGSVSIEISGAASTSSLRVVLSRVTESETRQSPREVTRGAVLELPVVFTGRYTLYVSEVNADDGMQPLSCRVENIDVVRGERTVVRAALAR